MAGSLFCAVYGLFHLTIVFLIRHSAERAANHPRRGMGLKEYELGEKMGLLRALIILSLVVLSSLFNSSILEASDSFKKGKYSEIEQPPASAQIVKVGFYPISVYQLEMGSNTYYIDAYVWLSWTGDIDPTASIEFTNMVEEWSKQQENLLTEPKLQADGSKYQIMRIEGRFVQPFSLVDYPLDQQHLTIMIEDTTHGADKIAYAIDKENSGIGQSLQIPGWLLLDWSSQVFTHDYGTSFGEAEAVSIYSAAKFSINIVRPSSFFYWKLLTPLLIVLAAGLGALFLNAQSIDARTALPAGALLTAIFLQKSYSDSLPDLGYLILMDRIYLVAYALIVLTLIRVITVFKTATSASDEVLADIRQMDYKIFIGEILVFFVGVMALIVFR